MEGPEQVGRPDGTPAEAAAGVRPELLGSKQHWLLSEATLLAFCCAQLKRFPRTNPDVTFCLEGKVSTLTVPGYTIYKHADADY